MLFLIIRIKCPLNAQIVNISYDETIKREEIRYGNSDSS